MSPKLVSLAFGVLVVCLVVGFYVFAAWSGPSASPPSSNAEPPLPSTGGTMSGELNMGNNKITNLATPTADSDAATKAYVDSAGGGFSSCTVRWNVCSGGSVTECKKYCEADEWLTGGGCESISDLQWRANAPTNGGPHSSQGGGWFCRSQGGAPVIYTYAVCCK